MRVLLAAGTYVVGTVIGGAEDLVEPLRPFALNVLEMLSLTGCIPSMV